MSHLRKFKHCKYTMRTCQNNHWRCYASEYEICLAKIITLHREQHAEKHSGIGEHHQQENHRQITSFILSTENKCDEKNCLDKLQNKNNRMSEDVNEHEFFESDTGKQSSIPKAFLSISNENSDSQTARNVKPKIKKYFKEFLKLFN
jgi:hypothetical protein